MGILGLALIAALISYVITREVTEHKNRIMVQFILTSLLGTALYVTGHIEDAGAWEGPRVAFGLIGLVIFYGSWINLGRFLHKLPKRKQGSPGPSVE